jgi:hypothetical protein
MIKDLEAMRAYQNLRPKLLQTISDGIKAEDAVTMAIHLEKEPNQKRLMEWLSPALVLLLKKELSNNHSKNPISLIEKLKILSPTNKNLKDESRLSIVDYFGKKIGSIAVYLQSQADTEVKIKFLNLPTVPAALQKPVHTQNVQMLKKGIRI